MAVEWTDIRDLPGGDFASFTQSQIELYLEEAALELNATFLAARYDIAHKYLAAHYLYCDSQGGSGAAGPVVSRGAGPYSKSYGAFVMNITERNRLDSTSYGRRVNNIFKSMRGLTLGVY